ncbi:MAG: MBL fold metallo-hydrolase [Acidimicrobiales bacterium]
MNVTFYGVRGSTPCPSDVNRRYGGNTACVAVEVPGEDPIVLDLGTGLRFWGDSQPVDGTFSASALITHIHWDHVQGLPFLVPIDRPGARLDIYGPAQVGETLEHAFDELMRPPYFPVRASELRGDITFHDIDGGDLAVGNAKVQIRSVPHCGPTNGYRIEWDGATIAYVSDHQAPMDGGNHVAESVLELCDSVDLLIHDAQYTPEEFREKRQWGHCSADYAVHVAKEAGVKRLALFHHDPSHCDDDIDVILRAAQASAAGSGLQEVIGAAEGLTVSFDR